MRHNEKHNRTGGKKESIKLAKNDLEHITSPKNFKYHNRETLYGFLRPQILEALKRVSFFILLQITESGIWPMESSW